MAKRTSLTAGGDHVNDAHTEHSRLAAGDLAAKGWFAVGESFFSAKGVDREQVLVFKVAKAELTGAKIEIEIQRYGGWLMIRVVGRMFRVETGGDLIE